ncbi:GntR family transcriptional regulator [Paenibacillus eucommiae]|uniref:DNA-binding LacI/PurR family transcriptional regulator n=1 Tax=Paenibacillus eucommiae TaxID=1355755 RepID=A0ABS4J5Y6_9BACL|nr:GntR family transcriptional regulator [Paenibacillus eucommiae]MBP1994541.1 DNA-binding LacI/PurR family transcriptional regulator [Paenibacillus eucommiae]
MKAQKGVPLYQQIIDDFKNKIMLGELKPNDPLPSQIELSRIYKTSEMTMRKALSILADEGFIYRIRKKGSFIGTNPSVAPDPGSSRLLDKIYFVHQQSKITLLNQSFYLSMFEGIKQICAENGTDFHLLGIDKHFELPNEPESGFIIFDVLHNLSAELLDTLERWEHEKRSLVTIQFYFPHLNLPYIVGDNVTGGFLATQHLLSLGHRKIGVILTGRSYFDINTEFALRLQGYRMALSSFNVEFSPELIFVNDAQEEDTQSGYEGFMHFMSLADPPTAIFAGSDYKALGALYAAQDQKYRVPEDISIIGYDGQPFTAYTLPRLTTVNQNTFKFGAQAAKVIFQLSRGEQHAAESMIAPDLIVRDSTARVKL